MYALYLFGYDGGKREILCFYQTYALKNDFRFLAVYVLPALAILRMNGKRWWSDVKGHRLDLTSN